MLYCSLSNPAFQHTAARRRLRLKNPHQYYGLVVSTHSRAEAAAFHQYVLQFD